METPISVGAYELGRRLGGARLGPVHEAWHRETGSQVALRLLEKPLPRSVIQRLGEQAPRLAALDDPHVVGFGEMDLRGDPGFLTSAYVEGSSLPRILDSAITPEMALEWSRGVARGLAALHALDLLHRDVKPSNVRIDASGRAVLVDVGLVAEATGTTSQTEHAAVCLEYVTPEHFMGQPLTPASDVYQWGLLAYRLVYGHLPNPHLSPQSAALARFDGGIACAAAPVPFLTRLVDVIGITLEFDAGVRPATGRQILELLESDRPIPRPSSRGISAAPIVGTALSRGIAVERLAPGVEDYEILRSIGKGAMGEVFEGVRAADGMRVAIKVLKPALLAEGPLRQRFEREVELMMSLDSPRVVKLLDYKLVEPWVYLVMELLEGEDLARRLEARGSLPLKEALSILESVLEGLAELHRRGIVHRDLKPGNIFLTKESGPKILDLGLARSGARTGLTAHGQFLGTPLYASPEMRLGEEVTPASDVFTLGTLLYEMVTGRKDFRNLDASETLEVALKADPALDGEKTRPLVLSVVDLFCRMTSVRPTDRFPDAEALAAQIRPILQRLDARSQRRTREATVARRPIPDAGGAPVPAPAARSYPRLALPYVLGFLLIVIVALVAWLL